jgi:phenylacetate-coenzyme A ligase PaaK-like adenylate-forming protein
MANPWDQRPLAEQRRQQNILLKQTILQMALMHVPFVRAQFQKIGLDARVFKGLDELQRLPLTMRRDVLDSARNPEGPRALILHGTAEGVKRFSDRSVLRRIAMARLLGGEEVQTLAIEAATRPVHLHWVAGPGGRIPVAYTRDDLDLFARAGARLASLFELARDDRLLNLVPFGPTLDFWGVFYMAHGVGMTALHFRREGQELARALSVFDESAATAVAVPADEAEAFVPAALASKIDLTKLRALIAVGGSLTIAQRTAIGEQLAEAGAPGARVVAAYGVAEGRVLWGECAVPAGVAETFGMHTFPDLEVLEVVSPETGAPVREEEPGEIVVTPLSFRGGGAPRWRSGDLALGGMTSKPCPNCGRLVPRIGPAVVRGAWQHLATLDGARRWIDLRTAGAAAGDRAPDWHVELVESDGSHELYVYVAAGEDPAPIIGLYEELSRLRHPPTQIVVATPGDLAARREANPGPWGRYEHP